MAKYFKAVSVVLTVALLCLSGCKKNNTGVQEPISKIALITGTEELVLDHTNEAVWNGIQSCGDTNNIEYEYYRPESTDESELTAKFETAAKEGAKVIIAVGDSFGPIIAAQQEAHKDIKYILIDASGNSIGTLSENTHCVMFRQEQAGYLAGYGVVKDGFSKLGFIGLRESETYATYGYGFVQGANDAAAALEREISVNVTYVDEYDDEDTASSICDVWYSSGTELIMVSANDAFVQRCAQKAVNNFGYTVGVNNDQSYLADGLDYNPFMTSAVKGLGEVVDATLEMVLAGTWKENLGGRTVYYGLQNGNYVYLPDDEALWLFKDFTLEDYEELKRNISSGTISVVSNAYPSVDEELVALSFTNE